MLQSNGKVQADETPDATATREAISSLDNISSFGMNTSLAKSPQPAVAATRSFKLVIKHLMTRAKRLMQISFSSLT